MNPTKLSTPFSCFVTGTDTHVGKTLVSAALLHKWTQAGHVAVGMKPVAAGAVWKNNAWHSDDTDLLIQAGNVRAAYETHTPYLWREPIAPHIAAQQAGCEMTLAPILSAYQQLAAQAQAVVVEGVGGFRVPLSGTLDTSDLAQALKLPVILVVGLKLGCINHALLTEDAIAARGLSLAGWVGNLVEADMLAVQANVETLKERIAAPLLGVLPCLSKPAPAAVAAHLSG